MRNQSVVPRPLLIGLAIVVIGMAAAGCEKRPAGQSQPPPATNKDQPAVAETESPAPAVPKAEEPAAGAKPATPAPAASESRPPASGAKPAPPASATPETPPPAPAPGKEAPPATTPPPPSESQTPPSTSDKAAPPAGETGNFKYVGVAACSMCHKGAARGSVYETWLASPHARAFENLGAENQNNEACLACHATGFGKPLAANVTPEKMVNVQCEACHGPGSEYKTMAVMKNRPDALQKGLVMPTRERCLRCHGGPFPKGHPAVAFDFETALKKIEHHSKPVAPSK